MQSYSEIIIKQMISYSLRPISGLENAAQKSYSIFLYKMRNFILNYQKTDIGDLHLSLFYNSYSFK